MTFKSPVTISDEAASHLQQSFAAADKRYAGLLVTLAENKGCAGAEYRFTPILAEDVKPDYEEIIDNGVTLYIPRTQILFVFGAELVLQKDKINTRLDFVNPNETSRCGCGESVGFRPGDLKP